MRAVSENTVMPWRRTTAKQLKSGRHPFTDLTLQRLVSACAGGSTTAEEEPVTGKAPFLDLFGQEPTDTDAPRSDEVSAGSMWIGARKCGICHEELEGCLRPGGRLCAQRACEGAFCEPCLREYYELLVEAARYAVPFMKCPSCQCYIRSALWQRQVSQAVHERWRSNAQDLLTLRCMECDEVGSLMPREASDRTVLNTVLKAADASATGVLLGRWRKFSAGEVGAEEVLDALLAALGAEAGASGRPPPALEQQLASIVGLVEDEGRRAVLQLGALRRWPKTKTACCDAEHCFKCKVGTHHEGVSCEEVQRRQFQDEDQGIQFCPGCGVATLKTEGCNHMICLCGESWTWDGAEVWVEEWLDEA